MVVLVMNQDYDVQVHADYVIIGNTALLRCHVSAYASSYVTVTSWTQDDIIHFYPNVDSGGKYMVLGNGDLYVNNVDSSDGFKSYTCRTVHRLTGETKTSTFPGHITVNGNLNGRQTIFFGLLHSRSFGFRAHGWRSAAEDRRRNRQ